MRFVVLASVLALSACTGCGKPAAGNKDPVASGGQTTGGGKVPVPGGSKGSLTDMGAPGGAPGGAQAIDSTQTLKSDEGSLAIQPPADAKAGTEAVAKVVVTPTGGFHVNTEYPVKLTLESADGVTVAKAELTKADVAAFDERQLAFDVKMTPAHSGSFTVNGTFKFAVCDSANCRPKKEAIKIAFAAK